MPKAVNTETYRHMNSYIEVLMYADNRGCQNVGGQSLPSCNRCTAYL